MAVSRYRERGFTLVEVAVVMIIGGVLLATFSTALLAYMQQAKVKATNQRLMTINDAMQQYISINGSLPCPAPRGIAIDQPGFGVAIETDTHSSPGIRHCDNATDVAGVTRVASLRTYTPTSAVDADGSDPGAPSAAPYNLNVRIGDVPTRSLNLPDDYIADGWGDRFIFAVTQELTNPYRFFQDSGGVSVIDSAGNTVVQPADSGHYVIISVGNDQAGGEGLETGAIGTPCNAAASDGENCDNDSVFRKTLFTSTSGGANQFDDLVSIGAQTAAAELLPSGGVMAFTSPACPPGWSEYTNGRGRVIAGVNPADPGYALGLQAGADNIALTSILASHTHTVGRSMTIGLTPGATSINYVDATATPANISTGSSGATGNLDNRQAYIALLLCRKD